MSTEEREKPVVPEPPAAQDIPAAQETSGVSEPQFLYSDAGAANASQRMRFIPPDADGKAASPWARRARRKNAIAVAEWSLTAIFFLIALYFLFQWLTFEPPVAYDASREGFLAALAALPPARPESGWRVEAEPGRWKGIVVHHTAGTRGTVASIDRYHREQNKWPNGLGYHFLIGNGNGMEDGEVATGPRWEKQQDGAHVRMRGTAKGNSFSIGVALVGNFETAVPSPKQLAALRGLLNFLSAEYGIPPSAVAAHGRVSEKHTACPGKFFFIDEVVKSLS